MRFDFTTLPQRLGKDALALDAVGTPGWPYTAPKEGFDIIPMWIADMNFLGAPSVVDAISRRLSHTTYGYFSPRAEYYDAICRWHRERKGVAGLKPEHIGYANGVLGGVVSAANVLCSKGDQILVHSPTYVGFTHALGDNGYQLVHSPLVQDEQGIWRMDYEDMESKLRDKKIHTAILCSPHNPCGRVWERWELETAMALFRKYEVYVISDEIWSDLLLDGHTHIPTQSVSEDAKMRTVAMYAPSKTFNLAGLVGSYSVIYNTWLRERIAKEASLSHYNAMNVLSMYGLIGAYSEEGGQWADQLCRVLSENVGFACDFIDRRLPGLRVSKPQGTYMLFVDCTDWCAARGKTLDEVLKACYAVGVYVQDGRAFHGACHLRMNLALPRSRVEEAFRRLEQYVFNS